MTENYTADADPQNILEPPSDNGYLCSDPISTYYIFTTYMYEYDSISTWYNMDDTKAVR